MMVDSHAIANLQMLMNTGDGRQAVLAELLQTDETPISSTAIKPHFSLALVPRHRGQRIGRVKIEKRRLGAHRLHLLTSPPLSADSRLMITDRIIQQLDKLSVEDQERLIKFAEGFAYHYNNLFMAVVGHISIVMFNLRPAHPLYEPLRDCEELIHNTALLIRLLVEVFHRPQHAPATAYPIDLTDREIGNQIFSIFDNQSPSATISEDDLSAQRILKIVAIAMAKRMKRVLGTIETQTNKIFRDRDIRARCGEHGRQIGIHLQRGIRIAEALLDFAKPQVIHKLPLELNAAAREAVSTFSACFSGLRITLECAAEPLIVRGDSYWLRKLLLELLTNANDACSGGGEVCLKILEKRAAVHPALSTNSTKRRKAQLIVADSGPGLPACLGIRAFDPFTCAPGERRRRGLGLAVVSGIVSALGGRIRFFNRPRGGFVINIELPLENETEKPPAVDFPLP